MNDPVKKECLAVVWGLKTYRVYLEGRTFTIYTDHQPLLWLHRMKSHNQRSMRWALAINQYKFDIKHQPGRTNCKADDYQGFCNFSIRISAYILKFTAGLILEWGNVTTCIASDF